MYSWLMFVATGIGPYSGQAVHFKHFAPEPKEYAARRYDFEAQRHWGILNEQLAKHRYMQGDTYTIVDMAVWGWARAVPFILGAEALKAQYSFKAEMDDEARRAMFPQNGRLGR
jgi:GSH-dependent disulfide-bond oxidoreductase